MTILYHLDINWIRMVTYCTFRGIITYEVFGRGKALATWRALGFVKGQIMEYEREMNNQNRGDQLGVIGSYLDSADEAREAGRTRLAVHLYCAAFELAVEQGIAPNSRVLDGMNQAWLLACEQGDHSSAETIFNDLLPYHSPEQTEEALKQLQELAFNQLEKLGLDHDDVADIAHTIAQEISQDVPLEIIQEEPGASIIPDERIRKFDLGRILENLDINLPMLSRTFGASSDQGQEKEKEERELNYQTLTGYFETLRSMRQFGFVDSSDAQFGEFLAQANAYHGISGPVLTDTFYFYGPSREDVMLFARATAGEIGWPVIEILVEIEDRGHGTIKVSGPIKRPMFGPPRISDLPRPCILIIHNIDLLQELFRGEEQAMMQSGQYGSSGDYGNERSSANPFYGAGPMGGMPSNMPRSLQAETLTHLNAFNAYGGVFVIVTAEDAVSENPLVLGGELMDFIGPFQEIEVPAPTLAEREEILQWFSLDHPSFKDMDFNYLASMSQGIARNELIWSAQSAIEEAYRESIRTGKHLPVTAGSFLSQLIVYLDSDSPDRARIEDAIVEQFSSKMEDGLFDL